MAMRIRNMSHGEWYINDRIFLFMGRLFPRGNYEVQHQHGWGWSIAGTDLMRVDRSRTPISRGSASLMVPQTEEVREPSEGKKKYWICVNRWAWFMTPRVRSRSWVRMDRDNSSWGRESTYYHTKIWLDFVSQVLYFGKYFFRITKT